MRLNPFRLLKNKFVLGGIVGIAFSSGMFYFSWAMMKSTSTNEYCDSCHVHPHSTETWKMGKHYKNKSGVVANCIDCHLPPEGMYHLVEKAKAGARDVYAFYFKDLEAIDWDEKSALEEALFYTFDEACIRCHQELFPVGMTTKGVDAHIHYRKHLDEVRCINCHLKTGHFHDEPDETILTLDTGPAAETGPTAPLLTDLPPDAFEDYTDVVPNLNVRFEMVAVQGGTFRMGTPESEPGRRDDEGPQRDVQISPFWIGKFEVSWREYDAYYSQTATRGKNEQGTRADGITGPTPPYGSPDQGWGKGARPAITMTHYAATKYCEWLSKVTGRIYRLPTEAEWEYAARAGTTGPFPFIEEVTESWFGRWQRQLFGGVLYDEATLDQHAIYRANSKLRSYPGAAKQPNPWGIYNMFGNVREFCLDYYDPAVLASYPEGQVVVDPKGPASGEEWVVRGGSFKTEVEDIRAGARDRTRHTEWLRTDPQTPKSVWWFSDANDVGFRIVREFRPGEAGSTSLAANVPQGSM